MPGQPVTVLLVEDNYMDAELITILFQRLKIPNPIVLVQDCYDALDVLRGTGGRKALARPYIILLDIHLPRMSGLEFLDELDADRELRESIVFLMIAHEQERIRYGSHDRQLAGYLVKGNIGREFLALPEEIRMV
jgi:CheY-like chemotaxis protein